MGVGVVVAVHDAGNMAVVVGQSARLVAGL